MLVDFYQRGSYPLELLVAGIARKLLADDEHLLVVAEDEGALARLDRMLWDQGPTTFLPHALSGTSEDARQPVLLSKGVDAPNRARNLLIADGVWRESALGFERAFFIFDDETLANARLTWKLLAGREGVERRYWLRSDEQWIQKA